MSLLKEARKHPRFFAIVSLLIGLSIGTYIFNFYSGIITKRDPVEVVLATAESLGPPTGLPPIIVFPANDPPLNWTYTIRTNGLYTVYEYWYMWGPNAQHAYNDWEPVYVYWSLVPLSIGGSPLLLAIATRFHFAFRLTLGGFALNGTQPTVVFSNMFHIPTVSPTLIQFSLRPENATILYNYPTIRDDNSPYATGPNAYEISQAGNAGPTDPWVLIGSPATVQNGLIYGTLAGLTAGLIAKITIDLTVHPTAPRRRLRIKKELLAFLE